MKIAVVKLGARISTNSNSTSGGTGEALSIIKILLEDKHEVHAFTKVLDRDTLPEDFTIHSILDEYDDIPNMNFDALVVINGNVNFFGGQEDRSQILNYHIINNFNGKVFYFHCDTDILLKQIWPSVFKKGWNYLEKDINITREDIIYISQVRDFYPILNKARKQISLNKSNVHHFPFEKFPVLNIEPTPPNPDLFERDLLYGGTFRGGKRQEDMVKFYWGHNPSKISVEMFGKIKESNFDNKFIKNLSAPIFGSSVDYNSYPNKMKTGLSTIIIGDPVYKKTSNLAQRIYESILIGNITFIDASYDHKKQVYSDKDLQDFLYVRNRKEVEERILEIKKDSNWNMLFELDRRQKENTRVDLNDYSKKLTNLLQKG